MKFKKKWVAVLLSILLPGLGHLYARDWKTALTRYGLLLLLPLGIGFISFTFSLFVVGFLLIIGYYIFIIYDAYRLVNPEKIYEEKSYDKWYVYIAILIVNGLLLEFYPIKSIESSRLVHFSEAATPAMEPNFYAGEVFAYVKTSSFQRNEIGVFKFPDATHESYVKRCIGVPGDTIQIIAGKEWINGKANIELPLKNNYWVVTKNPISGRTFGKEKEISIENWQEISTNTYVMHLSEPQKEMLSKHLAIEKIDRYIDTSAPSSDYIYPNTGNNDWNLDYFGPIYLPKKGDQIVLNPENIDLYFKCIKQENSSAEKTDQGITIEGQLQKTYIFKENYYFMMGDNRGNTIDSRFWGLLPENLILGKVKYNVGGRSWDRIGISNF